MTEEKFTWKDVVRNALLELGGQGHLSEINKIVEDHPKTKTNPTWQDTIRRVVRQYKIFVPVPPERSGVYKDVEELYNSALIHSDRREKFGIVEKGR